MCEVIVLMLLLKVAGALDASPEGGENGGIAT
jgi:hypothetical protein